MWSQKIYNMRSALTICRKILVIFMIALTATASALARQHSSKACKKTLWVTAVAGRSSTYMEVLSVALHSAAKVSPSVVPVVVMERNALKHAETVRLARSVARQGGIVTAHDLTFLEDFPVGSQHYKVRGTFARFDVGFVVERLLAEGTLDPRKIDVQNVLYTDSDIIFLRDIDACTLPKPSVALIGPQASKGGMDNVGVLYINVSAWNSEHVPIINYARERNWSFSALDQTLIIEYYGKQLEKLPDEFNWKGYWGRNPEAYILHFHGPKPGPCLECLTSQPVSKAAEACVPKACKTTLYTDLYGAYCVDDGVYFRELQGLYFKYLADHLLDEQGIVTDRDMPGPLQR